MSCKLKVEKLKVEKLIRIARPDLIIEPTHQRISTSAHHLNSKSAVQFIVYFVFENPRSFRLILKVLVVLLLF